MRIDKLLTVTGLSSRKDTARLIRAGKVLVNGQVVSSPAVHIDPERDEVVFCGETVTYRKHTYIMLNKPEGVVSATEDGRGEITVVDLLPERLQKIGLFPCGRLDKNTLGLVILTDNGPLAHAMLSPRHHVSKRYAYRSKFPITEEEKTILEQGCTLEDGYVTKPAIIALSPDRQGGYIILTEGKYHQIKRMFESVHNKIVYLERREFGPIILDETLERGQWRYFTEEEIERFENHQKNG